MAPFVSTVVNKIDAKGRVSVPAKVRHALASQDSSSVFCFKSFNGPSIEGFGDVLMKSMEERLAKLDPFSDEYDEIARKTLGGIEELSWDQEGRVKLPEPFVNHAGLQDQVAFVGLGFKFQIWNPETYQVMEERDQSQNRKGLLAGGIASSGEAT